MVRKIWCLKPHKQSLFRRKRHFKWMEQNQTDHWFYFWILIFQMVFKANKEANILQSKRENILVCKMSSFAQKLITNSNWINVWMWIYPIQISPPGGARDMMFSFGIKSRLLLLSTKCFIYFPMGLLWRFTVNRNRLISRTPCPRDRDLPNTLTQYTFQNMEQRRK